MLASQNQLRRDFEAELIVAMNFAAFVGRDLYLRNASGRYEQKWVEDRWLGYMLGRAHDTRS